MGISLTSAINNFIEEKLYHLHTAYIGKVIRAESASNIDVQPLTMAKPAGGEAMRQAMITGISCLESVWESIEVGKLVLCIVCERDITDALNGNSAVPALGRHRMNDSIIVGTVGRRVVSKD